MPKLFPGALFSGMGDLVLHSTATKARSSPARFEIESDFVTALVTDTASFEHTKDLSARHFRVRAFDVDTHYLCRDSTGRSRTCVKVTPQHRTHDCSACACSRWPRWRAPSLAIFPPVRRCTTRSKPTTAMYCFPAATAALT